MLEHNEFTCTHEAARCRTVYIKHILQCIPKQIQIFFRESCLFSEIGRDKTMAEVKTIRNCGFATQRVVVSRLAFSLFLSGNSYTSDGMLRTHNRLYGTSKSQLNRASYLTCIFTCCHDGTESSYIKIAIAHNCSCCFSLVPIILGLLH